MRRSTSKEAIRLWYAYLQRASKDPSLTVNKVHYSAWGEYKTLGFDRWWKATGAALFIRQEVEVIAKGAQNRQGVVVISVPLTLTPTDAGNAVRKVLAAQYKSSGHTPKAAFQYQLTEGKEIKVASLRAYLHTYDAYLRLVALKAAIPKGRVSPINRTGSPDGSNRLEVSGKELLTEVRRFYLNRTAQWAKRNSRVQPDALPPALAQGMTRNPVTGQRVNYAGEERAALQAVSRYLRNARQLVVNAAKGDFPGDYA